MINMAKGIRFLQLRYPREFARTDTILGFPQYWSFLLTGVKAYEATYQACHTYLWDQQKHVWSSVVDTLGIRGKMPKRYAATCGTLSTVAPDVSVRLGLDPSVVVTAGIHDSNASLLPYLAEGGSQDFVLNSTGTWCVCMHPQPRPDFSAGDLGKIVFFNRSALDQPVKTTIFPGGMELDTYVKLYQRECQTEEFPASDVSAVRSLLTDKKVFIIPEVVPGSGQFPGSEPGILEDGRWYPLEDIRAGKAVPGILTDKKRFFAALDLSMVIQSETALRRAGLVRGTQVCTEGGFRKNRLYNQLLASVLPENGVFLTNMKEATAAGCAMSALMALTGRTHRELGSLVTVDRVPVEKIDIRGFEEYRAAWLACTDTGRQTAAGR